MQKAKVFYFVHGQYRERVFDFVNWTAVTSSINMDTSNDNYWILESDILGFELIPTDFQAQL